jgi:hypothetical protein
LPEAAATAIEYSGLPKKQKNGQRRRSEIEATLQQGLQLRAERSAAGQFWTFTMSNSKTLVTYASRTFKARA